MANHTFAPGETLCRYLPGQGLSYFTAKFCGYDFITVVNSAGERLVVNANTLGRTPSEAIEASNAVARSENKRQREKLKAIMVSLHSLETRDEYNNDSEQANIRFLKETRDALIQQLLESSQYHTPVYECIAPRKAPLSHVPARNQ